MNTIKLNSNCVSTTTVVPNIFIDTYMPQANGTYVKVFLYLLRCINSNNDILFSISTIADALDETEKDITRALGYWEKVNLLSLTRNEQEHITSITINDLNQEMVQVSTPAPVVITPHTSQEMASKPLPIATVIEKQAMEVNTVIEAPETNYGKEGHEKPKYSPAQINQLKETEEVEWMLKIIEIYLGRTVSSMELQLILYLYESLEFSTDLIIYLYDYCVSKNKKNHQYVEAVAIAWHEEGITTVEKAEESTTMYDTNYNAVNKAFGLNRSPGQIEKQYIHKWLNKYKLNIDIIIEACNRTLLATGKPDFKYADKILETWSEKGVSELIHIAKLDEERKAKSNYKNQNKAVQGNVTSQTAIPSPNNRFNAFPQREYSQEEYNSLEQRLLERSKTVHR